MLNTLKDNSLVLTFMVSAHLLLVPEYDEINSVKVVVKNADFTGTEFNPAPAYTPVSNPDLLNYFVSQAARSMINNNVFGSGLIYLQNVAAPTWEMSSDK